ncbi:hypothetical protein PVT68_05080 [Microbulbifer bruguierae]|uniref:DUF2796 domain-containing protein n=1 Tax=Microbulbifer bruguierae TaxID=3029061 RepID=A0ABY8NFU1_9GAMM|nr:DUF6702 family protein [Microbulbifer bruguierae]WGL17668.1 hypothetical protein PVT68_05080 [Microbulbifer bruguierae]
MRAATAHFFKFAVLAMIMSMATQAHAHRYHFGLTELSLNPRTQTLEISHRFFVADIERALQLSASKEMKDAKAQAESYVNEHFQIQLADGSLLKPTWVGMESDVHDVWIYQEIPLAEVEGKQFQVRQSMLMEIERDQVNTLNLTRDGKTESFTLKPGASQVSIQL